MSNYIHISVLHVLFFFKSFSLDGETRELFTGETLREHFEYRNGD